MTEEQYYELSYYTLAHSDKRFIHQHIVDAYAAQTANEQTKLIKLFFALAGLYLYLEKNYTGKEVQQAHVQMTEKPKIFPTFGLPENKGEITVVNVLDAPAGSERDDMIHQWCQSVWAAYSDQHDLIIASTEKFLEK